MNKTNLLLTFFLLIYSCFGYSQEEENTVNEFWNQSKLLHKQNKNEESINTYKKCIKFLKNNKQNSENRLLQAKTYNKLGERYQEYAEWTLSLQSYDTAIIILDGKNDYYESAVLLNISKIFIKIREYKLRKQYMQLAKNKAVTGKNNLILIDYYKLNSKYDSAIMISKKINNNAYLCNNYYLKAFSLFRKDLDKSRKYLDSALYILPKIDEAPLQYFQVYVYSSEYYIKRNEPDSSLSVLKKAEKAVPILNDLEVDIHIAEMYSATYALKKDYKKAYLYKKKSISLNNKIKSTQKLFAYTDWERKIQKRKSEEKLEAETKNRNLIIIFSLIIIIIFSVVILKIRRLNTKLKNANYNKDRLFEIIAHDLRKPIISLNLLYKNDDNSPNNKANIQQGINYLLQGFDNLLRWSISQKDTKIKTKPKIIDINELIEENIEFANLEAQQKSIFIENNLKTDYIAYADEGMTSVCIRNVLSNAIKFSKNNTNVKIDANEENNHLYISILDSGEGFTAKHNKKGFGIGLEISQKFAVLNKGEIKINSSPKGSKVQIILPVNS